MKIRNGFVSNSSSSSFILSLPKDKKLRLSEIENYLGGYSNELTDDQKDSLSYLVWKSITRHQPEEATEHHEQCIATWDERSALRMTHRCSGNNYWSEEGEKAPTECKNCKYYKYCDRPTRSDDYYKITDNHWSEGNSIVDESKNNYYIEIDDNEPEYIDFDTAYELRRVDKLFNNDEIVVEVN